MADQTEIDATIDRLHAAGATDDEVTSLIKEKYGKPFDVNAQNATMRANMARQPGEQELQGRAASEPWTGDQMKARAEAGASGMVEGTAAGLAAPALALYHAVRHPVDTAETAGMAALGVGAAATHALAHPVDTYDKVKAAIPGATDAALRFASDPTNIGRATGGVEAGLMLPRLTKAAKATDTGQAVLRLAEKTPVIGRVVQAVSPSNATLDENFGAAMTARDTRAAADAAHAGRMAGRDVVPLADASATSPARDAMTVEKRGAYGAVPGQSADEHVRSLVVPTADAVAASRVAAPAVGREAVSGTLGRTAGEVTDAENVDNPLLAELRKRYPAPQEPDVNIAESGELPGRVNTPTHSQTGQGGRGHEATPAPTPVTTNGSGTAGGGSLEEVNRAAANKAAGTRFALHGPGGLTEIADQAGAQDIQPGRGRALVRITKDGDMTVETAGKGYTGVGVGKKATTLQEIATRVKDAPDAATARKLAEGIIERERSRRLSASDKQDMIARVMDIIAERRRGGQ